MTASEKAEAVLTRLAELRRERRRRRDDLAKIDRLLGKLPQTLGECLKREKQLRRDLKTLADSSDNEAAALARSLTIELDQEGERSRRAFLKDLRDAARQRSIEVEFIDRLFLVKGLRLVPDLGTGNCRIELAGERVEADLPLDPKACLDAVEKQANRLLGKRDDPARLLKTFLEAYQAVCGQHGHRAGESVPIVDMLVQVALLRQASGFRRDPSQRNYRGYERCEFSADLMSLRRSGRMEIGGRRLLLQTAVIDTAGDSAKSISVPDDTGRAMVHYQALAFVAK